jgi:hypothetical protein
MDLRSMRQLLDTTADALREKITKCRGLILQLERWHRPPFVLSDYDNLERTKEQQLADLNRWHDDLLRQLRFVHRFGSVVRDMDSKASAAKTVR